MIVQNTNYTKQHVYCLCSKIDIKINNKNLTEFGHRNTLPNLTLPPSDRVTVKLYMFSQFSREYYIIFTVHYAVCLNHYHVLL